jgi:hypothetical protein
MRSLLKNDEELFFAAEEQALQMCTQIPYK